MPCPIVRSYNGTKVSSLNANVRKLYWFRSVGPDTSCWRYQAWPWTVEPTSEVKLYLVGDWPKELTSSRLFPANHIPSRRLFRFLAIKIVKSMSTIYLFCTINILDSMFLVSARACPASWNSKRVRLLFWCHIHRGIYSLCTFRFTAFSLYPPSCWSFGSLFNIVSNTLFNVFTTLFSLVTYLFTHLYTQCIPGYSELNGLRLKMMNLVIQMAGSECDESYKFNLTTVTSEVVCLFMDKLWTHAYVTDSRLAGGSAPGPLAASQH